MSFCCMSFSRMQTTFLILWHALRYKLDDVSASHDDVIKWKHFPRYWSFVQGIHPSPVNSPDKGQWRGALMFSLICARINSWVNNAEAGDLRRHSGHYDVIIMDDAETSFNLLRKLYCAVDTPCPNLQPPENSWHLRSSPCGVKRAGLLWS